MANQVAMGRDKILEAIAEAAKELASLQQRASQLRDFIALGKSLLGEDDSAEAPPLTSNGEERVATHPEASEGDETTEEHEGYTVADWARKYLEEVRRPMRVPEIAKALVEREWVKSSYATEAIRTAMARRDDFERIALGVYALKEWPASVKRWRQGPSRRVGHRKGSRRGPSGIDLAYSTLKQEGRPMHINQIIKIIEADGHAVNKPSLLRGIYRCVKEGRLFYLHSPGTFGLLEWQDETPQQREESEKDSSLFTE